MRLRSNDVKFAAVDEPSSALDPQGECDLFQHLREARMGKTMIFVTHRFGHLTKFADQIM
jgi:energy-coupling factor transporter ATP-binding protein EcfA2